MDDSQQPNNSLGATPVNSNVQSTIPAIKESELTVNAETEIMTSEPKSTSAKSNWIPVSNENYLCSECENTNELMVNTPDGLVKMESAQILDTLQKFPTKNIYTACAFCGMEFSFKNAEGVLYVEPSDREK